jgi:hypothetical protein
MTRVLSFDVGMKNLAYCLFQVGENRDDYKVLKWDVINLCTPVVRKCNNGDLVGAQSCINDAKYCRAKNAIGLDVDVDVDVENDNEIINIEYYCKKHAKKSNLKIPPSDLDIKKIRKGKLVDIQAIIDKYQIKGVCIHGQLQSQPQSQPQPRQKNSKEKMIDMIQGELDNNYLDNIENVRATDMDLVTLGKNMMIELDKIVIPYNESTTILGGLVHISSLDDKYNIDIVIIENQISTIASRMKTLQGMIAQYFIMKYTPHIEFISAANKLKMFMTKKKTTYTERKLESVEVTKELLETLPQLTEYRGYLDKNKKKDDLADCFLQGVYYLTLKNMITIKQESGANAGANAEADILTEQ